MKNDPKCIYSKLSNGRIYSPFTFHIDPMERLAFIDIKKDRDKIYSGFELQVLSHNIYGEKILVRAERNDGFYDVYYQPGMLFDIESDIMGERVADLIERPMKYTRYEVASKGVDVYFSFEDKTGRYIEGILREDNEKRSTPFTILAPVGSAFAKPPMFPLYLLFDMYFPQKTKTQVKIIIDGTVHQADTFPIPLDWSICYFSRYSTDTFIVNWNRNFHGKLSPLNFDEDNQIYDQNTIYNIVDNEGHYEIKDICVANKKHQLKIDFAPAVPDIVCLKDGISITGKFTISSKASAGLVIGEYDVWRSGDEISIKVHPVVGWKPNERKWSLKFLYAFDPIFKKWPSTYIWTARIELNGDAHPVMDSKWKRTEKWKEILLSPILKLSNNRD